MLVALFSTEGSQPDSELAAALAERVTLQTHHRPPSPDGPTGNALADELVAAEVAVAADRPDAVLIGGGGPPALAAALAAAKLNLPIGRLGAGDELADDPDPGAPPRQVSAYGRLVDRLAVARFCVGQPQLAALERAGLGAGAVVAGVKAEGLVSATAAWLDQL
jgi:UDP-N-acetylglucosamine 2-epimerase